MNEGLYDGSSGLLDEDELLATGADQLNQLLLNPSQSLPQATNDTLKSMNSKIDSSSHTNQSLANAAAVKKLASLFDEAITDHQGFSATYGHSQSMVISSRRPQDSSAGGYFFGLEDQESTEAAPVSFGKNHNRQRKEGKRQGTREDATNDEQHHQQSDKKEFKSSQRRKSSSDHRFIFDAEPQFDEDASLLPQTSQQQLLLRFSSGGGQHSGNSYQKNIYSAINESNKSSSSSGFEDRGNQDYFLLSSSGAPKFQNQGRNLIEEKEDLEDFGLNGPDLQRFYSSQVQVLSTAAPLNHKLQLQEERVVIRSNQYEKSDLLLLEDNSDQEDNQHSKIPTSLEADLEANHVSKMNNEKFGLSSSAVFPNSQLQGALDLRENLFVSNNQERDPDIFSFVNDNNIDVARNNNPLMQSGRSTVLAQEDHHITDIFEDGGGPSLFEVDKNQAATAIQFSHSIAPASLIGDLVETQKSMGSQQLPKTTREAAQRQGEVFRIRSSKKPGSRRDNSGLHQQTNSQIVKVDDRGGEESKNHQEPQLLAFEELIEDETQIVFEGKPKTSQQLIEIAFNDLQAQQRGRASALDEVEDDDLVNQNSSKSSSRSSSQDDVSDMLQVNNQSKQPSLSQVQNESSSWAMSLNINRQPQRNYEALGSNSDAEVEEEKQTAPSKVKIAVKHTQEEADLKSVHSSTSSRKKRNSATQGFQQSRFTYFAASGLSDDRWLCPICLDIFEDAVETPCCHNLFCEACIKRTPSCPLCNMRINPMDGLKPNIPIRRLVLELSISCPNDQCDHIIRKGEIDKHIKVCQFTQLSCPNNDGELCGLILRKDFDLHINQQCPYRVVGCLLKCSLNLPLNQMDHHITFDCPKSVITCKNACGNDIERGDMERHLKTDCPLENVDCPNKGDSLFEEGCCIRLKRKDIDAHKLTCNFRKVQCPNHKCSAVIIYKDLPYHDERCLYKVVDCENECGQKIQRQYLDRHRDQCEFQLVRCAYFDLGCKFEILRKDYGAHLKEESFKHSIVFIEGQKRKNKEIDELKFELINMRQNYDVEIQAMFMELNRVKEDMALVKSKTGIHNQGQSSNNQGSGGPGSELSGPKMILGANTGLGGINILKRDERRYAGDHPGASSAGSSLGGFFEHIPQNIYRRLEQRGFIMSGSQSASVQQNHISGNPSAKLSTQNNQRVGQQRVPQGGMNQSNNSGSLESLMQSITGSSYNQNMIASQQSNLVGLEQNFRNQPNRGAPRATEDIPNNFSNVSQRQQASIFASSNPFFAPPQGTSHQLSSITQRKRETNIDEEEEEDRRNLGQRDRNSNIFSFRGCDQQHQLHSGQQPSSSQMMILGDDDSSQGREESARNCASTSINNQTFNMSSNQVQRERAQCLFGENSNRGRIMMLGGSANLHTSYHRDNQASDQRQNLVPSNLENHESNHCEQERKQNQMALFLGSMDSSQNHESNTLQLQRNQQSNTQSLLLQSYNQSRLQQLPRQQNDQSPRNGSSSIDFWRASATPQTIFSNPFIPQNSSRATNPINNNGLAIKPQQQQIRNQAQGSAIHQSLSSFNPGPSNLRINFDAQGGNVAAQSMILMSNGVGNNNRGSSSQQMIRNHEGVIISSGVNNNNNNQEDLDSSNVLYDDDFEIEEEQKNNFS